MTVHAKGCAICLGGLESGGRQLSANGGMNAEGIAKGRALENASASANGMALRLKMFPVV